MGGQRKSIALLHAYEDDTLNRLSEHARNSHAVCTECSVSTPTLDFLVESSGLGLCTC